jgi:hypothetical protein
MSDTKETIAKAPSVRPKRIPVGYRNRFEVSNKDPNFTYRIVKDAPGRVQEFLDGGYEPVDNKTTKLAAPRVDGGSSQGSVNSVPLGGGDTGVLMRIPKEMYEEDQKAKMDALKQKESALSAGVRNGSFYGKLDVSQGQ